VDGYEEDEWGYIPKFRQDDAVKYAKCEKLLCRCPVCDKVMLYSFLM
jgi:hypothetical protein